MKTSLPLDLILEILLRLPLQYLLKCKLVSKEWYKLTKDLKFITYRNKSTAFFLTGNKLNCVFGFDDDNSSYNVRCIPIELDKHHDNELLLESSNKLACVKADNSFFLYNLYTGESHVVADAPFRNHPFLFWLCYGFGYNCYEDDYTITVVCSCTIEGFLTFDRMMSKCLSSDLNKYDTNSSLIFIYSLRNRGWKLVEGFCYDAYHWERFGSGGAYSFKGALHWVVIKTSTINRKVVVAIDNHTYKFVEILLPPIYYEDSTWTPTFETLTELDGNLCSSYGMLTFDVWVMKEYGVPESWTKLFNIRRDSRVIIPLFDMTCTSVYQFIDHAKVVVFLADNSSTALFMYDIDKERISRCNVDRNEIEVFYKSTCGQKWNNRTLQQRLTTWFKKKHIGCLIGGFSH